jgi:protein involved in polysaccharide export with SLBB domain
MKHACPKLRKTLLLIFSAMTFGTLAVYAKDDPAIPPPSEVQPERIHIPIKEAQTRIANNDTGDANDEEIAAFSIAAAARGWIPENSSGRFRNGMMVRVTVMVQGVIEHATEHQRINHSGKIGLPLLQNVDVGEKDIEVIEEQLTQAYAQYYKDPLVNIEFVGDPSDPSQSPWGYVTLMGNIASPGPLSMPPTQLLTISGALKLAGGTAASANKGSIRIFRPHPEEDSVEVIRVDLEILAKKGKQAEDVSLRAGDVVYIPERIF